MIINNSKVKINNTLLSRNNIGNTKDDNKIKNIVIMVLMLITIYSKVKLKINKIVTKQIHFL